jgi:hypothetical protein
MRQPKTELILTESSEGSRGRNVGLNPNPEGAPSDQINYILNELAGDLFQDSQDLEESLDNAFDRNQFSSLLTLSQRVEQDEVMFRNKSGVAVGRGAETRPKDGEPLHTIM